MWVAARVRRGCGVQAFCRRQNLAAGRIHFARGCENKRGPRSPEGCGAGRHQRRIDKMMAIENK